METQAQSIKTIDAQPLQLKVYHANEAGIGVASVIVYGKTDAILIDAQFTLADAENVAKEIKSTGKKLTAIYVSHGDPDYYFGLEVFKRYFPGVTVYATTETVEHIKATAQKKLGVWGGQVGDAITKNIILPQIIKGTSLDLEGQKLEIIGLNEFPQRTFIWIPSIKAVVGGINVFGDNFHLWMADDKESTEVNPRGKWLLALQKTAALKPEIVIPAHGTGASSFNLKSIKFTEDYLQFYQEALRTNKTSAELIKTIKAKYPNLAFETALQIGAKVNTGEMKW
ncbi:MBL fold metallo-hydrolase [Pedobacter lithocola]|uniref:MBL fold metallo-hydrolase n=1 Tax=Pedobacter lithocola TaxID=1908239 RepID=A0ABV8PHA2_9SPHI